MPIIRLRYSAVTHNIWLVSQEFEDGFNLVFVIFIGGEIGGSLVVELRKITINRVTGISPGK